MSRSLGKLSLLAAALASSPACSDGGGAEVNSVRNMPDMPMPAVDAAVSKVLDGGTAAPAVSTVPAPVVSSDAATDFETPFDAGVVEESHEREDAGANEPEVDAGEVRADAGMTPHAPEAIDAGANLVDAGLECTSPYVPYHGECVDPIPACEDWPEHATSCIDKIEDGERIPRFAFTCLDGYEPQGDECVAVAMDAGVPEPEPESSEEVDGGNGETSVSVTLNPSNSMYYPRSFIGTTDTTLFSFNIEAIGPSEVIFGTGDSIVITFYGQQEGGAIDENISCSLNARSTDGETWTTYSTNTAVQSGLEKFEFSDAMPLIFQNESYTFGLVCDTITGWTLMAGDRIAVALAVGDGTVHLKLKDAAGTVTDVAVNIPITITGPTLTANL